MCDERKLGHSRWFIFRSTDRRDIVNGYVLPRADFGGDSQFDEKTMDSAGQPFEISNSTASV